jgi:hypothetical protein
MCRANTVLTVTQHIKFISMEKMYIPVIEQTANFNLCNFRVIKNIYNFLSEHDSKTWRNVLAKNLHIRAYRIDVRDECALSHLLFLQWRY